MELFLQQVLNGLMIGSTFAVVALGFSLVFSVMRVVNMAYGAYYLLGGYVGLSIAQATGSFALALVGGGVAVVALGYVVDRFLIRHTGENHLAQVLLTVGIAFVIGDIALKIWGGDSLKVPVPLALRGAMELPGGLIYPTFRFVLIVFGVVAAAVLWLLYTRTQVGAVSCGFYDGTAVLDLDYAEDSTAGCDGNFVLTADGGIVEAQVTAEGECYDEEGLLRLLRLARIGCNEIFAAQLKATGR